MTVCKLWHDLMSEMLYRSVQLENLEQLRMFSAAIRIHRRRARAIETFHLRDLDRTRKNSCAFTRIPFAHLRSLKLVDVHIQKIAPRFAFSASTVKKLACNDVTFASNDSLKRFVKCFTGVKELSVDGIHMDEASICSILHIVGNKLENLSITSSVRNLENIFTLIPNVKRLDIVVPSKVAWMMLSPYALPQGCEEIHLQSGHLPFIMDVVSSLSERGFLPALKVFPRITWYRQREESAAISQELAFSAFKDEATAALVDRGIHWTERESSFTMLEGTSHRAVVHTS